jgi:hypothetical protein
MEHKRTVVAAAAASAALIVASTAFAATSGIFGTHRSDKVGSFEPIEQVLQPAPPSQVPTSHVPPVHTAFPDTSLGSEPRTEPREQPDAQKPTAEPETSPSQRLETGERHEPMSSTTVPEVESHGSDNPITTSTVGDVPTTDDGRESDD